LNLLKNLERAKGFEPSTPTLARSCSTPELHPHPREARRRGTAGRATYAKSRRRLQQSNDGSREPAFWGIRPPNAAGGPEATGPDRPNHDADRKTPIRAQAEPAEQLYGPPALRQNAPAVIARH